MRAAFLVYSGSMKEIVAMSEYGDMICVCGNEPSEAGFVAVDEAGREVDPHLESWATGEYACLACGRVINEESLMITRKVNPAMVLVES